MALAAAACVVGVHAAGPDFTAPAIAGQPVFVVDFRPGKNAAGDAAVLVENRSPRAVTDVGLVIAGVSCTSKPAWPGVHYARGDTDASKPAAAPIPPGGQAEIRIAAQLVRDTERVAETTCGAKAPLELAVDTVEFADGTRWSLSEALRPARPGK